MTIISLRGTNGSGKTSTVRNIMHRYQAEPDLKKGSKKPLGYTACLPSGETLYVVGGYENDCGGCDGIQPYADIWPRVVTAASTYDHVIFEGVLVSTSYGAIGEASTVYGSEFVWAFLDTPFELCCERINNRRAGRGADPMTDFARVQAKVGMVDRLRVKLENGTYGPRITATIRHETPMRDVLKLLGVTLAKEPK